MHDLFSKITPKKVVRKSGGGKCLQVKKKSSSGVQIKSPQHGHISWIEGYKKSEVKKVKNTRLSALLK